jgi:hypothetical protein
MEVKRILLAWSAEQVFEISCLGPMFSRSRISATADPTIHVAISIFFKIQLKILLSVITLSFLEITAFNLSVLECSYSTLLIPSRNFYKSCLKMARLKTDSALHLILAISSRKCMQPPTTNQQL